jgi:hypothetical protein
VVEGVDSAVWHTWQSADGDDWRGWHSLGRPGALSDIYAMPALARNHDGRLELFMEGNDGMLRHRWQRQAGHGPWSPWASIGSPGGQVGILSTPVLARNHDGRLELFVRGSDGAAWHVWQHEAGGGPWKPWHSLGKPEQTELHDLLEAELRKDGCLELFMAATDGAVWHCRQQEAGRGPWESWESLGGVKHPIDMVVGAHADGRLILFVVTSDPGDKLWWREQTDLRSSDEWSGWTAVSGTKNREGIERPVVGLNADGRLELWLLAPGTTDLCHVEQASPNGKEWTVEWVRLGVPGYSPAPRP